MERRLTSELFAGNVGWLTVFHTPTNTARQEQLDELVSRYVAGIGSARRYRYEKTIFISAEYADGSKALVWETKGYYYPCGRPDRKVVSWAKLGFLLPAALTSIYGFLSLRLDECSVLDYIKRAVRFFITTQQYYTITP